MSEAPSWDEVVEGTGTDNVPDEDVIADLGEVVISSVEDDAVVPEMSKDEAERLTGWIKSSTEMLSVLLYQAREGKAWKALGYESWETYCNTEFDFSGTTGYRKAIHGEVVSEISGHLPEGAEVKLSQKDAKDIREFLPEITETIDEKREAGEDIDIDQLVSDVLEKNVPEVNDVNDDIEDVDIEELLKGIDLDTPIPSLGDNAAAGLDTGAGSIGEARKKANAQHAADAAGAPEFDASNLSLEDIAAIRGKSLTPANAVRSFVTWNERLPDPVDAARTFRDDSLDDEFVEELPDKLRGVRNWIDRFLDEFSKVPEVSGADESEEPSAVIEEISDTEE